MMLDGDTNELIFGANFEDVFVEPGGYAFYREVSGFTATQAPVEIQYHHPSVGPAAEGNQHLELDGINGIAVELTESLDSGLLLRFQYSPRPGVDVEQGAIEVWWNDELIQTVTRDGSRLRTTEFEEIEIDLVAISKGSGRLEFRSNSPGDNSGLGGLIDMFRFSNDSGRLCLTRFQINTFPAEVN